MHPAPPGEGLLDPLELELLGVAPVGEGLAEAQLEGVQLAGGGMAGGGGMLAAAGAAGAQVAADPLQQLHEAAMAYHNGLRANILQQHQRDYRLGSLAQLTRLQVRQPTA